MSRTSYSQRWTRNKSEKQGRRPEKKANEQTDVVVNFPKFAYHPLKLFTSLQLKCFNIKKYI